MLSEDQRNNEYEDNERNMQSMRDALLMQLYNSAIRNSHNTRKSTKTKGKHKNKTTKSIPIINTLRQRLMQRQMMIPRQISYAQPYTPQQEMQLQKAKDQNSQAQNALNTYKTVLAQQQSETRRYKDELKKAKDMAKEEARRASEAEQQKAELEKQQEAYRIAHDRYTKAKNDGELSELELQNESLLAQIHTLEFETEDRKSRIKQNEMYHKNTILKNQVDQLTAERDAYDKLMESKIYSDSISEQTALLKQKKLLEHERDIKQKLLEQRAVNHELDMQLKSYPSSEQIDTANKKYDEQIALALEEQMKLKNSIEEKENDMYETQIKKDILRDNKRKRVIANADLARITKESESMVAPEEEDYNEIINEIASLNFQIDSKKNAIEDIKTKRTQLRSLKNKQRELINDRLSLGVYNKKLRESSEGIDDDITRISKNIGTAEANVDNAKKKQQELINKHDRLTRLQNRYDAASDSAAIEDSKSNAMKSKAYKIRKGLLHELRGNVAEAETKLSQLQDITKQQNLKDKAVSDLQIEESKQNVMKTEEWLNKGKQITQMMIDTARANELQSKQESLNKASAQHLQDGLLTRFYKLCSDREYNLDYHAHEIDNDFLKDAGITEPEDIAAILTAISDKRKESSDYATERIRVADMAKESLRSTNNTANYNFMVKHENVGDILNPPEMPRNQFRELSQSFAEWNGTPNLFDTVFQ